MLLIAALAGGCSTAEVTPLPEPRIVRVQSHERGGALAASAAELTTQTPLIATLRVVALETLPERGQPLADRLRLIARSDSSQLLETSLDPLDEARVEELEAAEPTLSQLLALRARSCGTLRAAVLEGVATVFELVVEDFAPTGPQREGITLRLGAAEQEVDLAIVLRSAARAQEEVALLRPLSAPMTLLILVPAPFDPGYEGYALVLSVRPPNGTPDEPRLLRAALRAPERTLLASLPRPARGGAEEPLERVRAGHRTPADWRALADALGARVTERVAFAAERELLEIALAAWEQALEGEGDLTWRLERASLRALAGSGSPFARALLLERCGAVGREDPAALLGTLDLSSSLAGWEELLLEDNRSLLESTQAAHRARAYRWLEAREAAPAGYDPFAGRAERRAALRRAGL